MTAPIRLRRIAIFASVIAGVVVLWLFLDHGREPATGAGNDPQRKVLYWHDPMVPGFKSDQPGKSPFMDMELVPVYAQDPDHGVQVRPEVSSSLGIRTAKAARLRPTLRIRATGYISDGTIAGQAAHALVDLYDRAAHAVRAGQQAQVAITSLPGHPLRAVVTRVTSDLGIGARGAKAMLRFSDGVGPLRTGDLVSAEIVVQAARASLIVPTEAVIRAGSLPRVVRALDAGRFESVEVVTGEVYHEGIAILRGLSEGDQVVVSGQFLLDSESGARAGFGRMEGAP